MDVHKATASVGPAVVRVRPKTSWVAADTGWSWSLRAGQLSRGDTEAEGQQGKGWLAERSWASGFQGGRGRGGVPQEG